MEILYSDKNIAVCGGSLERFIYRELLAGFKEALAEKNLFLEEENILCSGSGAQKEALAELLRPPPEKRPDTGFNWSTLLEWQKLLLQHIPPSHYTSIQSKSKIKVTETIILR